MGPLLVPAPPDSAGLLALKYGPPRFCELPRKERRKFRYVREKDHADTIRSEYDRLTSELEFKKKVRARERIPDHDSHWQAVYWRFF